MTFSSPFMVRAPYGRRLSATDAACRTAGIDALLVTHPPNLRYLAGFAGSAGALLVGEDVRTLIVDGRYRAAARALVERIPDLRGMGVEVAERSYETAILAALGRAPSVRRLGVEAASMTVGRYDRLAGAVRAGVDGRAVELVPVERIVERSRIVKDDSEIAMLREAAARLSGVAREALRLIRPGRTEAEIAADVDAALRRAGFERPAFDTIVASGPNSALPHARPGPRRLAPGDGVVLDLGGIYDGYCVDLTRTVQLAPLSDAFGRIFDAVRAAHAAAIACVRPGIPATAVDTAARSVLARHGLAAAFVHGTGHGLGLEVHEEPRISSAETGAPDETLQPGMVFTIEPGAYVEDVGGVRIEDDVLVVDGGCEVLTQVPIDPAGGDGSGRPAPYRAGE